MNVFTMFDGDTDEALSWIQHDCYWHSLRIIKKILNENFKGLELPNLDHRTVQNSHDILAGAFRYEFHKSSGYKKAFQDEILGKNLITYQAKDESEIINEWQNWLEQKMSLPPFQKMKLIEY